MKKPVNYKWIDQKIEENKTGTPDQYYPYPTTNPKVEAWVPKGTQNK